MNIPKLALGTGGLMKGHNETTEIIKALKDGGGIHIDTAQAYRNQTQVGKDIKTLDWDKVFVTTKVHPSNMKYHTRESVLESIEVLGHADLVLLHGPVSKDINVTAFKELLKLRDEKKIGAAGVSNFTVEQINELFEATGEYPANNQIFITPTYVDEMLIDHCQANGIQVSAFSPLNGYYRPDSKFYMSEYEREYIDKLAKKYNKTPANIIFRWLLDRNINVVFQSRKPERVSQNLPVEDFHLTEEEVDFISTFDKGIREVEMPIPSEEQSKQGMFINR